MKTMEKCGKCGEKYSTLAHADCPHCTYDDGDTRAAADFRAFRREIVLALVSDGFYHNSEPEMDSLVWKLATRIARAEPKGE